MVYGIKLVAVNTIILNLNRLIKGLNPKSRSFKIARFSRNYVIIGLHYV